LRSYGSILCEMFALLVLLATLHLTAKDNHKSYTVKPRTPIVVTLASNATSGYHWKYKSFTGNRVVKLISQRYVPPKQGRPGAAGKEVWHFRAVAKGVTDMRFRYIPSVQPSKPAKRIGISIRVR